MWAALGASSAAKQAVVWVESKLYNRVDRARNYSNVPRADVGQTDMCGRPRQAVKSISPTRLRTCPV